jgi:hypothetical protein
MHKYSVAYTSSGQRRYNQPFSGTNYAPSYEQGDVVGVGYRPRTGTVFFTRNGKKLEDIAHGLKSQNLFPTVGANGPCNIQVNFGQMGFVFIEANVKKWGLAPMTGSLAPPPPYGSEQGSILLEGGREGIREGQGFIHGRTHSASVRLGRPATSPGPRRSPTEISLAQLSLTESREDIGEGTSYTAAGHVSGEEEDLTMPSHSDAPPPEYESPDEENQFSTPRASMHSERSYLLPHDPPIPSYEAAVGDVQASESRNDGN